MDCVKVSIIMAAYNASRYIDDCIKSLIDQTYTNWELWICDDASTDDTFRIISEWISKDERINAIRNETNMFAGTSRNRCLEKCTGEYVMIQDADDISEKNRIELLLNEIKKTDYDFVSSGHYLFDNGGTYRTCIPSVEFPQKGDFLSGMPFCHAATMFKIKCFRAVNGYRIAKETRRGQDYDLFMRLYAEGYKGKNISDVLYGYRVDRETISRRKFKYRLDECKIRYKGFKALGLLPKGFLYVIKPVFAYFFQLIKGVK